MVTAMASTASSRMENGDKTLSLKTTQSSAETGAILESNDTTTYHRMGRVTRTNPVVAKSVGAQPSLALVTKVGSPQLPQESRNNKPPSPRPSQAMTKVINYQRINEEMRGHITKLKSELESEKARCKQLHRDKVSEVHKIRTMCAEEQQQALLVLESRLQQEKEEEIQNAESLWLKEKDHDIRQLLGEHELALEQQKSQLLEEKEEAIRSAVELQKKSLSEQAPEGTDWPTKTTPSNSALVVKLQKEIRTLRDVKKELGDTNERLTQADSERSREIENLQTELSDVREDLHINEERSRNLDQQLENARESLHNKEQQLSEKVLTIFDLTQQRDHLLTQVEHWQSTSAFRPVMRSSKQRPRSASSILPISGAVSILRPSQGAALRKLPENPMTPGDMLLPQNSNDQEGPEQTSYSADRIGSIGSRSGEEELPESSEREEGDGGFPSDAFDPEPMEGTADQVRTLSSVFC